LVDESHVGRQDPSQPYQYLPKGLIALLKAAKESENLEEFREKLRRLNLE
jgi:hypothetical protein